MIGQRTLYAMAQVLGQQPPANVITLLAKHGGHISIGRGTEILDILRALRRLQHQRVMVVLAELVATSGDLRHSATARSRFDERMHDLTQCLMLDGYQVDDKRLVQIDPTIADAVPIDDDLIDALRVFETPSWEAIIQKIEESAQAFRTNPPDYNASLVSARIAFETFAGDVALAVATTVRATSLPFDRAKWDSVITYLRKSSVLSFEEEQDLGGVYAFLCTDTHRPMPLGSLRRR